MQDAIAPYSFQQGRLTLRGSCGEIIATFGDADAIGVAFDRVDGTLIKHGDADRVEIYATNFREALAGQTLASALLEGFTVIRIPVSKLALAGALDELNAAIEITGRVKTLSQRLSAIMAPGEATLH